MPDITLRAVSKVFPGDRTALWEIDLDIREGEFLAVLGPSGSGKSTLLRVLAGLATPTSGAVRFGDRDGSTLSPRERDAAIVFQNQAPYPHLSVRDNLAFSALAAGASRRAVRADAEKMAASLGLGDRLDARPAALSGGQKQRVSLGRVLVRKPSLILLDEPFSNLDPPLRSALVDDLRALRKRLDATIVLVTHEPREAAALADRIAFLDGGRLVQVGPPEMLRDEPATVEVGRFFAAEPRRPAI